MTGKPVLATDQEVLVSGNDVVSGRIGADQNGGATVEPSGTWKLVRANGAERDLRTSSLLEAYEGLGLTPLPAGPAPAEVFAFKSSQSAQSGAGGGLCSGPSRRGLGIRRPGQDSATAVVVTEQPGGGPSSADALYVGGQAAQIRNAPAQAGETNQAAAETTQPTL